MNAIPTEKVYYPDSDGQPMADNTKQADEIVWLKAYLAERFANDRAIVFDTCKPGDSFGKFWRCRESYNQDGVEEWFIWDEQWTELTILIRSESSDLLRPVNDREWVSPRTGVTFVASGSQERITHRPIAFWYLMG